MTFTWMVWPKRRTAPLFEGDIKLTRDETLARGRTRLLLGSWKADIYENPSHPSTLHELQYNAMMS